MAAWNQGALAAAAAAAGDAARAAAAELEDAERAAAAAVLRLLGAAGRARTAAGELTAFANYVSGLALGPLPAGAAAPFKAPPAPAPLGVAPPPAQAPPPAKAAPPAAAPPAKAPPPAAPPAEVPPPPPKAPPPAEAPLPSESAAAAGGRVAAVRFRATSNKRPAADAESAEEASGDLAASSGGAAASGRASPPRAAEELWANYVPGASPSGQEPRSRRGSTAASRASRTRFANADWEPTTLIPAPYFVASGRVHGFKVHVCELPAEWTGEDAEQWIVDDILEGFVDEPDDVAKEMELSEWGNSQIIMTWRFFRHAVRAKELIHDFVWGGGVRANAKFWNPRGYSPWGQDDRFPPRP